MATRRMLTSKIRKLSAKKAKRVARSLQRATMISKNRAMCMKPLSLKSTATGKGTVVFRAVHVLDSFARAGKS